MWRSQGPHVRCLYYAAFAGEGEGELLGFVTAYEVRVLEMEWGRRLCAPLRSLLLYIFRSLFAPTHPPFALLSDRPTRINPPPLLFSFPIVSQLTPSSPRQHACNNR